ncbi:hypothetical protein RFI_36017 [Reticulomyxa filosa]|uniref:Uncharacterized protein n=1 Tax=Reticulomyxa filosa TaxID=46433 RepID=X6LL47_RETFI|nr:hypothetical protein RFI_36017 [Reticulomyxa filosa]|eukprot:ETO01425.1 hypothetical protein RFI_36017 [Reticulomyxa filosa]
MNISQKKKKQVKYLQDHLNGMRALMQDKESIIENLVMRFDLQILPQDTSVGDNIPSDKLEDKEMRRKAEALAQRTILENFELRVLLFTLFVCVIIVLFELVNELRDENFQLRNEIYDLIFVIEKCLFYYFFKKKKKYKTYNSKTKSIAKHCISAKYRKI